MKNILRLQKDFKKERIEKEYLLSILAELAIKSPDRLRTANVIFYKFKTIEFGSDILIALGEEFRR